ncbi:MAG: hypothetical protein J2P36_34000 [Ktedonobacteraceae bacterium]|nr:hypothetical protein [Ktedonobacteraceae bacterium]
MIGPTRRHLLRGSGGQLNDQIGLSLLDQRAKQGKHLAVEWVVVSCHLNELAL